LQNVAAQQQGVAKQLTRKTINQIFLMPERSVRVILFGVVSVFLVCAFLTQHEVLPVIACCSVKKASGDSKRGICK
jgi:hypothetical protein